MRNPYSINQSSDSCLLCGKSYIVFYLLLFGMNVHHSLGRLDIKVEGKMCFEKNRWKTDAKLMQNSVFHLKMHFPNFNSVFPQFYLYTDNKMIRKRDSDETFTYEEFMEVYLGKYQLSIIWW